MRGAATTLTVHNCTGKVWTCTAASSGLSVTCRLVMHSLRRIQLRPLVTAEEGQSFFTLAQPGLSLSVYRFRVSCCGEQPACLWGTLWAMELPHWLPTDSGE